MSAFNTLKTTILLGALTALLVIIGGVLAGSYGAMTGLVLAIVMNFASYWFSDSIALQMAGAREVSPQEAPQLHRLVEEVAQMSGLPKPRVAIIQSEAPNAFATGRNSHHALVAVTTGILQLLDERELRAVISHELGHIRNKDILVGAVAATIAGAVTMVAQIAKWGMIFGDRSSREDEGGAGIIGDLLLLILAPIAAMIIQMAISRSREYGADETGAEVSHDPLALASALEKLEAYSQRIPLPVNPAVSHLFIIKPLTGESLQNLFSTHPPTGERIARLRRLAQQMGIAGGVEAGVPSPSRIYGR